MIGVARKLGALDCASPVLFRVTRIARQANSRLTFSCELSPKANVRPACEHDIAFSASALVQDSLRKQQRRISRTGIDKSGDEGLEEEREVSTDPGESEDEEEGGLDDASEDASTSEHVGRAGDSPSALPYVNWASTICLSISQQ